MPTEVSPDSAARLASVPAAVHHVHLIGVAGTAMAALAGMLAERGFRVTGSDDQLYEPTASLLRRSRVEVTLGFGPQNLSPAPDLVVVGNVIPRAESRSAGAACEPRFRTCRCPKRCGISSCASGAF